MAVYVERWANIPPVTGAGICAVMYVFRNDHLPKLTVDQI